MITGRELGLLAQDHLEVLEAAQVIAQTATAYRRAGRTALAATFGVGQVDQAVFLEIR